MADLTPGNTANPTLDFSKHPELGALERMLENCERASPRTIESLARALGLPGDVSREMIDRRREQIYQVLDGYREDFAQEPGAVHAIQDLRRRFGSVIVELKGMVFERRVVLEEQSFAATPAPADTVTLEEIFGGRPAGVGVVEGESPLEEEAMPRPDISREQARLDEAAKAANPFWQLHDGRDGQGNPVPAGDSTALVERIMQLQRGATTLYECFGFKGQEEPVSDSLLRSTFEAYRQAIESRFDALGGEDKFNELTSAKHAGKLDPEGAAVLNDLTTMQRVMGDITTKYVGLLKVRKVMEDLGDSTPLKIQKLLSWARLAEETEKGKSPRATPFGAGTRKYSLEEGDIPEELWRNYDKRFKTSPFWMTKIMMWLRDEKRVQRLGYFGIVALPMVSMGLSVGVQSTPFWLMTEFIEQHFSHFTPLVVGAFLGGRCVVLASDRVIDRLLWCIRRDVHGRLDAAKQTVSDCELMKDLIRSIILSSAMRVKRKSSNLPDQLTELLTTVDKMYSADETNIVRCSVAAKYSMAYAKSEVAINLMRAIRLVTEKRPDLAKMKVQGLSSKETNDEVQAEVARRKSEQLNALEKAREVLELLGSDPSLKKHLDALTLAIENIKAGGEKAKQGWHEVGNVFRAFEDYSRTEREGGKGVTSADINNALTKAFNDRLLRLDALFEEKLRSLEELHATNFQPWNASERTDVSLKFRSLVRAYKMMAYAHSEWNNLTFDAQKGYHRTVIMELADIDIRENASDIARTPNLQPFANELLQIQYVGWRVWVTVADLATKAGGVAAAVYSVWPSIKFLFS